MSVVKINAITIPEGMGPQLEGRFAGRAKMVEQFGTRYEAYRQRVPMFFPTPKLWRRLLTPAESAPGAKD